MNGLVNVGVKASRLLLAEAPNIVATWAAVKLPVPRNLAALQFSTTERAVSVAGVVPEPFIRRHSLFGVLMTVMTSVVSELPRSRMDAWSFASLLLLTT